MAKIRVYVIEEEDLRYALDEAFSGTAPGVILAELYANSESEKN